MTQFASTALATLTACTRHVCSFHLNCEGSIAEVLTRSAITDAQSQGTSNAHRMQRQLNPKAKEVSRRAGKPFSSLRQQAGSKKGSRDCASGRRTKTQEPALLTQSGALAARCRSRLRLHPPSLRGTASRGVGAWEAVREWELGASGYNRMPWMNVRPSPVHTRQLRPPTWTGLYNPLGPLPGSRFPGRAGPNPCPVQHPLVRPGSNYANIESG